MEPADNARAKQIASPLSQQAPVGPRVVLMHRASTLHVSRYGALLWTMAHYRLSSARPHGAGR